MDDNYSIEYTFYEKILQREEQNKKMNDERYNPLFDMSVYLFDGPWDEMLSPDNRFVVIDTSNPTHPIFNYAFQKKRFSNLEYIVAYDCLNKTKENCTIDQKLLKNGYLTFMLGYNGFILDHQNKTSPLYRYDVGLGNIFYLYLDDSKMESSTWSIVKYREEKGFFSIFNKLKNKDDEDYDNYIGLRQTSNEITDIKDPFYFDQVHKKSFLVLAVVNFVLDFNHYEEYKRTSKSLLNTFANICSLSLTVFNGFCLVFSKFYSNNFDNYKIIEKILFNQKHENFKDNKNMNKNKTTNEIIELRNDFNSNKTDSLIDKPDKRIEENENEKDLMAKTEQINKRLPKLKFLDFLFNNIYGIKCFKRNYKQEMISKCHEIISKYYSMENILYNQIKLESLFKDYKWNDLELNNFKNNELIIQLTNLISYFNNTNDNNDT